MNQGVYDALPDDQKAAIDAAASGVPLSKSAEDAWNATADAALEAARAIARQHRDRPHGGRGAGLRRRGGARGRPPMSTASAATRRWPRCGASKCFTPCERSADGLIGLSATIGALAPDRRGRRDPDRRGRARLRPSRSTARRTSSPWSMVILVFGGMALCDRQGGHIAVDLLERRFPPRLNRLIDIVAALMGAVIFGFIAWAVCDSREAEPDAEPLHQPPAPAQGSGSSGAVRPSRWSRRSGWLLRAARTDCSRAATCRPERRRRA